MEIVRCENGHFFDGEKYKSCPHCSASDCDGKHRKSEEKHERPERLMGMMIPPSPLEPLTGETALLEDEFISEDPINSPVVICERGAHKFESIQSSTSGIKYRCKKCGLEAASYYPEKLNKEYCGSIVDNQAFIWHPDLMNLSDIVQIKVSYGDYPIRNVTINGQTLTYKNSINWSRDGWMSFSEGFFDPHMLTLSAEQKNEVFKLLCQLNLSSWETDPHIFNNLDAPGFCLSDTLTCKFSNGYSFICYSADKYKEFHLFTSLLDRLTGRIPTASVLPNKAIPGIKTPCCEIMIPERFSYCPICGLKLENKSDLLHTDISYDFDQTCWLCECLESNAFNHRFCGNCGKKRPW